MRSSVRFRRSLLASSALVTALVLSACGSGNGSTPSPSPSFVPTPTPTPSASSPSVKPSKTVKAKPAKVIRSLDAITVSGPKGKASTLKAAWPIKVTKTMTKVISPGSGPVVSSAQDVTIEVNYVGVNARTGKLFDSSFQRTGPVKFPLAKVISGFSKGLTGQRVGSRVLIAIPSQDGYSTGNAQAGIEKDDTLLFVCDILSVTLDRPDGSPVAAKSGLPRVSPGTGAPAVTIPKGAKPPTSLVVQPVLKGKGAKVSAQDSVTVNYLAVNWATGKVVDSSYGTGRQTGALSELVPAWRAGLVGQRVGSRVMIISPPAMAYPQGNATPSIPPGATLVYVVDILYTQQGQAQ